MWVDTNKHCPLEWVPSTTVGLFRELSLVYSDNCAKRLNHHVWKNERQQTLSHPNFQCFKHDWPFIKTLLVSQKGSLWCHLSPTSYIVYWVMTWIVRNCDDEILHEVSFLHGTKSVTLVTHEDSGWLSKFLHSVTTPSWMPFSEVCVDHIWKVKLY